MKWVDRCYLALAAIDLGFTFFGIGAAGPNGSYIVEVNPVWTWVMSTSGKGAWALVYLLQIALVLLLASHGGRLGRILQLSVLGATASSVLAWLGIVRLLL